MAERRMFSKTIIDSDMFMDLPITAQNLYFHLSMRADDDGFINNPKKIMRMTDSNDDDLNLLISKKLLIPFESGIVAIRHWRMHNYIQKDRYKPTVYQEEKSTLELQKNGMYTECVQNVYSLDTEWIQNGYSLDTQDRLGKDRLGKDSIYNTLSSTETAEIEKKQENDDKQVSNNDGEQVSYRDIITQFNSICKSLPKVNTVSDKRKRTIKTRLKEYSFDKIITAFEKAEKSDFLTGKSRSGWTANFDWIMLSGNIAKILDGNYDNPTNKIKGRNDFTNFNQREYNEAEIMDKLRIKQTGG